MVEHLPDPQSTLASIPSTENQTKKSQQWGDRNAAGDGMLRSAIPVLRVRQENRHEFKANVGYLVNSRIP